MIVPSHIHAAVFGVLVTASISLLIAGYFMPEIRIRAIFQPREKIAEILVQDIAAREKIAQRKTGQFNIFSASETNSTPSAFGLDLSSAGDFYFDANVLPNKKLRVRALPRSSSVVGLKARPRIYAAELSATGDLIRSGWLP